MRKGGGRTPNLNEGGGPKKRTLKGKNYAYAIINHSDRTGGGSAGGVNHWECCLVKREGPATGLRKKRGLIGIRLYQSITE